MVGRANCASANKSSGGGKKSVSRGAAHAPALTVQVMQDDSTDVQYVVPEPHLIMLLAAARWPSSSKCTTARLPSC